MLRRPGALPDTVRGAPTGPILHVGETAGVPALLCRGLNDLGHPAEQVVPPVPAPFASDLRKALTVPDRILTARRLVRTARPSILHAHYATSAIWYLDQSPLVVHCHGTDVREARGLRRRLLEMVFARSSLVLYATPDLRRWVPPGSVYLPNPVDTDLFRPEPAQEPDGDVLIFAAATDVKGIDRQVDIVRALRSRRPQIAITTIDMGDQVGRLEALGVRVVPQLGQQELPTLIRSHRVVLGQQRLPALGTAELQAMACSRPVVGVADPNLYPDPPPVWSGGDPHEAATEVLDLLEDEDTVRGAAARAWVERVHGILPVCRQLEALYDRLGHRR
jgi:glycosyltransferase involved in cell wall biosynthesis